MAVSFLNGVMTQSGIINDAQTISEFLSIAGVTSSLESGYTLLIIPYKLIINGTMNNTSAVAFKFTRSGTPNNEVTINAGGRWNYKESRTVYGFTDWKILPNLVFTQTVNNGYNGTANNLIYLNGGTQDFAKIEIKGNGGTYWNGGTVIFRKVLWNAEGLASVNDNQITTQSGNPTLDIIDFEYRGVSMFLKDFVKVNLSELKPTFASRGFGCGFGQTKVLEDFEGNGTVFDGSIYGGGYLSFLNPAKGGGVTFGAWNAPNNVNNEYDSKGQLLLTATNESKQAVLFKVYHQDNNSGAPIGAGITGTNYTLKKTYNVLSNVGGVASLTILLSAGLNDNLGIRRSAVQTNDLYVFLCFSYLSQPTFTKEINFLGKKLKTESVTLLKDQAITELVKATVDAYATIDTLGKLYDRAKSYLFDNFAGETTTLFLASGTVIDAGNKNIVIDSLANLPFSYNLGTNIITLKSSLFTSDAKFKTLQTTGNVIVVDNSLANIAVTGKVIQNIPSDLSNVSATTLTYNTATDTTITLTNCIIGTIKNDGIGIITILKVGTTTITDYSDPQINFLDSSLSFNGVASLTAYPTATDRDNNTNAGFTKATSPFDFKFNSIISGITMNGIVYMRLTIGTTVQLSQVTIGLGSNVISLTDNSLLQGLQANLQKVNRNLLKESLLTPIFLKESF